MTAPKPDRPPSKPWRVESPDGLAVDCRTMPVAYVQVDKLTRQMNLVATVYHWVSGVWVLYEIVEPATARLPVEES